MFLLFHSLCFRKKHWKKLQKITFIKVIRYINVIHTHFSVIESFPEKFIFVTDIYHGFQKCFFSFFFLKCKPISGFWNISIIWKWFYCQLDCQLQVVSYELWVANLGKQIYELPVPFYELQSNFTSCKFILRVQNKIKVTSSKFNEIVYYELKILKLYFTSCHFFFTSWRFKMVNLKF